MLLAKGSYGEIYGNGIIAYKKPLSLSTAIREISCLSMLENSRNIVKLIDHDDYFNIFMKQYDGNLCKYYTGNCKYYILSLLYGLYEIHRCGIIHGDIKPDNLLYTKDKVVICDFGLSLIGPYVLNIGQVVQSGKFRAPEIENKALIFSTKIDIYSAGILARIWKADKNDPILDNLIQNMTMEDPKTRYDIIQCMNHPYFGLDMPSIVPTYTHSDCKYANEIISLNLEFNHQSFFLSLHYLSLIENITPKIIIDCVRIANMICDNYDDPIDTKLLTQLDYKLHYSTQFNEILTIQDGINEKIKGLYYLILTEENYKKIIEKFKI